MRRREFLSRSLQTVAAAALMGKIGFSLAGCETDVVKFRGKEIRVDLAQYPMLRNVGGRAFVQVETYSFILVRKSASEFLAFTAVCPHQGCLIGDQMGELHQHRFVCLCHGAEFDSTTGAVLKGPATSGLTQYDTVFDAQNNIVKIFV